MLMFLGVLLTGHSFAEVETDCTTDGKSSNGQINATTNCTSTDTGAAQAERNKQNDEALSTMGNAASASATQCSGTSSLTLLTIGRSPQVRQQ